MSPSFEQGEGLSSRHLPDESDGSFSFQIPATTRGDDLLADDGEDFLRGADFLATPAPPSRFALDPLTLSQLTPRPSDRQLYKSPSPPQHQLDTSEAPQPAQRITKTRANKAKPKPNAITRVKQRSYPVQASPAGERIDNLKAQVERLTDDLDDIAGSLPSNLESNPPLFPTRHSLNRKEGSNPQRQKENAIRVQPDLTKGRQEEGSTLISKDFDAATAHTRREPSSSLPSIPQFLDGGDHIIPDSTVGSERSESLDGVARRLLIYSQTLVATTGNAGGKISNKRTENPFALSHDAGASRPAAPAPQTSEQDDRPLTVSQLSPEKGGLEAPQIARKRVRGKVEKPPTSSSSKRPATSNNSSDEPRSRKKARPNPQDASAPAASGSSQPTEASVMRPPIRKSARRVASSSRTNSTARAPNARDGRLEAAGCTTGAARPLTRARADLGKGGSVASASRSTRSSSSSSVHASINSNNKGTSTASHQRHLQDSHPKSRSSKIKSAGTSLSRGATEQEAAGGSTNANTKKTGVVRATIPHEFRFLVDARLEARKSESEKPVAGVDTEAGSTTNGGKQQQQQPHGVHPIPDFKASHAAQEAESALRKENIRPVVPLPIRFETDARLKERHKFDELIREKEARRQLELEQRRKEREEQDEREIRELRRKAIPKAHEVPEWYREAPKKVKGV
ncbi:hypothetical protein FA15DRAFT_672713 [Coprinopsis marcescibilis]|uniref:TPX2 C-terminal domain-containing protein n=1 Tax=Coprinopsis marcescibilis TaxID=230819 RepID=A0A5C3KML0_COPMA|nr:hypothetical protein FA15DRAFT_672713 [Coprinopsis marcescibilis]